MKLKYRQVHNCCTSAIIFNLEAHSNNGQNLEFNENYERSKEPLTHADVCEVLSVLRARGYGTCLAITCKGQSNAEKILEDIGFLTFDGRFKSRAHPESPTKVWVFPIQDVTDTLLTKYLSANKDFEEES